MQPMVYKHDDLQLAEFVFWGGGRGCLPAPLFLTNARIFYVSESQDNTIMLVSLPFFVNATK